MNLLYYNTSWKSIELRIPRITLFTTSQFVLKTWTIRYNIPNTSNALVPPSIVNLELVDYPRPSEKAVDIQTSILNFERVFVNIVNKKGRKILSLFAQVTLSGEVRVALLWTTNSSAFAFIEKVVTIIKNASNNNVDTFLLKGLIFFVQKCITGRVQNRVVNMSFIYSVAVDLQFQFSFIKLVKCSQHTKVWLLLAQILKESTT